MSAHTLFWWKTWALKEDAQWVMRLNTSLGNVCTIASHFNIHGKLLFMISLFSQESVDGVHHVFIMVIMDMCTHHAVGSRCSSLTLFICLPFSHLLYRFMILIILMFVGGHQVEGNYTYIVCWGWNDAGVKVYKLFTGYFQNSSTFSLFFCSTFFNHPNNTRSEYNWRSQCDPVMSSIWSPRTNSVLD